MSLLAACQPATSPREARHESPAGGGRRDHIRRLSAGAVASHPRGGVRRSAILLVEDHADTAAVLTRLLRQRGHVVTCVSRCDDALWIWRRMIFDLLICDIQLPDGDGWNLYENLRRIRHVPGIALTGHGFEKHVARSCQAGFAAHVLKPVTFDRLAAVIDELAPPVMGGLLALENG